MTSATTETHPALGASSLTALFGVWLFLSPWLFGVAGSSGAWNSWVVGALVVAFGAMRRTHPAATRLSWINSALGVWIFASPWIYGYVRGDGWFVNSLCLGILLFSTAIIGANSEWTSHHTA